MYRISNNNISRSGGVVVRFDVVFSPFSPLSASSASLHPVGGHPGLPAEAGQGEQVTILTPRQAE
ncbi:hypothetical protein, partial [Escherichia coli]|uniref:hypothetical protein n=1 Tax=Escherichia coli TaxID=562 RepID=UPI003B9F248E